MAAYWDVAAREIQEAQILQLEAVLMASFLLALFLFYKIMQIRYKIKLDDKIEHINPQRKK